MKIVKFNDDTYGIRKGFRFPGYWYLNRGGDNWFSTEEYVARHCKMSRERAEILFNELSQPKPKRDYGTPVVEKHRIPPLGVRRCNCGNPACN